MEALYKPLEQCKERLCGRSMNAMRLKQIRERALSEETFSEMQRNPYLEIWDVDYYSTSDEEDNDSGKESESESDSETQSRDSEVDSEGKDAATGNNEEKKHEAAVTETSAP